MSFRNIEVVEKENVVTNRMRKELFYNVKISFSTTKVIFDHFILVYFCFIYRFKIYRCFIDYKEQTFNFSLKLRDLNAVKELMKNE